MTKAYCLIEIGEHERVREIRQKLEKMKGKGRIVSTEVITGPHDLIVVLRGPNVFAISDAVLSGIRKIDGITRTITMIVV